MSQYKAAVIGLGKIGMEYDLTSAHHPSSHVMAYTMSEGFELICAMDVKIEKRQILQQVSPATYFYTDIQEMFANHSDIDIVSVCSPPQWHLCNLEYLIRQTNVPYIFCEKPLITSIDELNLLKELLDFRKVVLVPNISRRWSKEIQIMREKIALQTYGALQKVIVRYTRGIYNTGAHLFDLLRWCGVKIIQVQVLDKVYTTSEKDGEATFSFIFRDANGVRGYVEAFDDTQYYFFDIDFYFFNGKIEFKYSGDEILYYSVGRHHLFPEFLELKLDAHVYNILADSCLAAAMKDWMEILDKHKASICSWKDAIYPLYVARALEESYETGQSISVKESEDFR